MLLFKDMITGADLFSDSFNPQIENDFLMIVSTKMKKFSVGGETFDIGQNASEEGVDQDDGDEVSTVQELEFAYLNGLQPFEMSKKDLKDYLKHYCKNLSKKVLQLGEDGEGKNGAEAQKKFEGMVKDNLKDFLGKFTSNSEIFVGKEFFFDNYDSTIFIVNRSEDGMSGTFTCVKPFLTEEKL